MLTMQKLETLSKDVLATIALELELPDIISLCKSHVRINEKVCQNQDFWNNKLYRDFPDYVSIKDEKFKLYLFDNQLTEIPREIGRLHNLRILYLDNNQLKEIPKEIGDLQNLEYLNLSHNPLTIIPQEIENIRDLIISVP